MRKKIILVVIIFLCLLSAIFLSKLTFAEPISNIAQAIPSPSLAERIITSVQTSWPWYIVRGSGILAAISLVILMLTGIGSVTGHTFRFLEPINAWVSHRALGIVFAISVLIHMVGLLFDHFVSFSLLDLLVPWLSNYKPVSIMGLQLGSFYVALGVLAFYGAALIVIISLLWIEQKPRLWKLTHLLSYVVMLFVFVHALYLGTDLSQGLLRWIWIALGVGIAFAVVHRLWRARSV